MAKRSVWKGPFINELLLEDSNNKKFKTTSRNTIILPFLAGKSVAVHNGKFFIPLFIRDDMIGYKLGEFVATRLRHVYKKKKKNGSKIKSK